MIVLKSFSNTTEVVCFKDSIISRTNPWINGSHRTNGLYSKIKNNTITILNVENDFSLRGANLNIYFYGIIIRLRKKEILFGYIGPSIIFTVFTLLILICPFEYLHIRIIALLFWVIIYFGNMDKISYLKEFLF